MKRKEKMKWKITVQDGFTFLSSSNMTVDTFSNLKLWWLWKEPFEHTQPATHLVDQRDCIDTKYACQFFAEL